MSILIKLKSSNILTDFVRETAELASEIIESKTDNGKIGPLEWFHIFRESLDVIALFDELKGHGVEFSETTNAELTIMAKAISEEMDLSENTTLTNADIVHILNLCRSISALVVKARK